MTNVDFFRGFADDTTYKANEYYFEHSREELDFSNLYDGEDSNPIKMFHYTDDFTPFVNETGRQEGVEYTGGCFFLVSADLDEVIDTQRETAPSDGKYESHVKDLIQFATGMTGELTLYNNCTEEVELEMSGSQEIYNQFDNNLDGVLINYTMYIKNV